MDSIHAQPRTIQQARPTSVYRYYDRHGMLIYVGITGRGIQRNREHNIDKEWWPYVVRQDVEHYPHRQAATEREKHLIRKYHPPFNKMHNAGADELRAIYLLTVATIDDKLAAPELRTLFGRSHGRVIINKFAEVDGTADFMPEDEFAPLVAATRIRGRIILRAPKKVGVLIDMKHSVRPILSFRCSSPLPFGAAVLNIKSQDACTFWLHEAVAADEQVAA